MDEVLSVNKVAELTGAKVNTIREFCYKGQLKATKQYGRWEIRLSDLLEFAQMREEMAKGRAGNKKEKLGNENCRIE